MGNNVWFDEKLDFGTRALYAYLMCHKFPWAFQSLPNMAKRLNVSVNTIRKRLVKLVECGYLLPEEHDKKPVIYHFLWHKDIITKESIEEFGTDDPKRILEQFLANKPKTETKQEEEYNFIR